jgi:hypothetical protein
MAGPDGRSDASRIEAAYLHACRMRDVGATMGYELVSFVANNLCQIFEAINAGAEYRGDLIGCHIEALLLAKQERYRSMRPEQLPELSNILRRVVEVASIAPPDVVK